VLDVAVPAVLDQGYARGLADLALHDIWLARETGRIELPPSALALDPGDTVALAVGGRTHRLQLTAVASAAARRAETRSRGDAEVYTAPRFDGREGRIGEVPVYGPSTVAFLDLPLLTGTETEPQAPRLAAHQRPWPGTVAVYRGGETGFSRILDVATPAAMGELTSSLDAGPLWRWDRANRPTVRLYSGELASLDETAVLGGGNAVAVEATAGRWEILQFTDVELVGPAEYRLSGLLRGQRGSDADMAASVAAGARIVVLDADALAVLPLSGEQRLRAFTYRYGPGPHTHDHFTFAGETRAFDGIGLRPYAPAHVRAARTSGGDVAIAWTRRTRLGGDVWDNADVPLGEETEAYEIEIMDGAAVVRTIAATSPAATYAAAEETADFGGPQSMLTLRVAQISASFGRGAPREVTANV
jgi:hypothetical protein